jgi:hypothetical protein
MNMQNTIVLRVVFYFIIFYVNVFVSYNLLAAETKGKNLQNSVVEKQIIEKSYEIVKKEVFFDCLRVFYLKNYETVKIYSKSLKKDIYEVSFDQSSGECKYLTDELKFKESVDEEDKMKISKKFEYKVNFYIKMKFLLKVKRLVTNNRENFLVFLPVFVSFINNKTNEIYEKKETNIKFLKKEYLEYEINTEYLEMSVEIPVDEFKNLMILSGFMFKGGKIYVD